MRLALFVLILLAVLAARLRAEEVDLELLLLVDVSRSMSPAELEIQRRGYAEALTSGQVAAALGRTMTGRIALAYVEWAGESRQTTVRDWTLITRHDDLAAFAATLLANRTVTQSRTSIAAALRHGASLLDENRFEGLRRVIDISGDGPNNNGMPVTVARDEAVSRGFTVNGLPLMIRPASAGMMDIENLDYYYEDCVIGGAGAFVVPVKGREHFKQAIRTKLMMEVAGLTPAPRAIQVATRAPRTDCMIGERLWQRRFVDP